MLRPRVKASNTIIVIPAYNEEAAIGDLLQEIRDAGLTMDVVVVDDCLLYTSPSPRDQRGSRMPSSA